MIVCVDQDHVRGLLISIIVYLVKKFVSGMGVTLHDLINFTPVGLRTSVRLSQRQLFAWLVLPKYLLIV